jgi:hypothetical protein
MEALLAGLGKRTTPSFLVHLRNGVHSLDVYFGNYGMLNPRVWSDVDYIEELSKLPGDRIHQLADKLVWEAASTHGAHIHAAIMCPPDIYGHAMARERRRASWFPSMMRFWLTSLHYVLQWGERAQSRPYR